MDMGEWEGVPWGWRATLGDPHTQAARLGAEWTTLSHKPGRALRNTHRHPQKRPGEKAGEVVISWESWSDLNENDREGQAESNEKKVKKVLFLHI